MSDGQINTEGLPPVANAYYNPEGYYTPDGQKDASSVPDLQEVQRETSTSDGSVSEHLLNVILSNQAQIIQNQEVIDTKLNSIGQILDYMGQTVQQVAQTFQSGGGLKGLMGMLGGGGNQNNG